MAVIRRKRADQTTQPGLPRLPQARPAAWPPDLYKFLSDLMRTLEGAPTIVLGIQDNGTDMPLRSKLNLVSGVTVTDNQTNDSTDVTVP